MSELHITQLKQLNQTLIIYPILSLLSISCSALVISLDNFTPSFDDIDRINHCISYNICMFIFLFCKIFFKYRIYG